MNSTTNQSPAKARRRYRQPEARWEGLSARIETHASLLADQGDVVLKSTGASRHYWYLRFFLPADQRGHRRQCSLYVGRECDQELVARVRALLEGYRERWRSLQEIAAYLRVVRAMSGGARAAARHVGE